MNIIDDNQFIEVDQVISDRQTKINITCQYETISISDIKSFRPWHKGKKDELIEGDMTIIVLRKKDSDMVRMTKSESASNAFEEIKDRDTVRTILIRESYSNFIDRLGEKTPIKRLK